MRPTSTQPDLRVRKLLRRASSLAALVGLGAVVFYHLHLLWARIVDPGSLQPSVVLRWILTLAVIAAVIRLRRLGISLLSGRPALVLWVIVLLIHVQAPFDPAVFDAESADGLPADQLLLILPVSISIAVVGRILLGGESRSVSSRRVHLGPLDFASLLDLHTRLLRAGFLRSLAPRAPPAQSP